MINSQANPDSCSRGVEHPIQWTLEEFLENDLEGYEYVKGELAPHATHRQWNMAKSVVNVISLHLSIAYVS